MYGEIRTFFHKFRPSTALIRYKPVSNQWTYVGKTVTVRFNFGLIEVVDGIYLLGGLHPQSLHEVTANEVCRIIDTDRVECEIVGDKSELGLIGHLEQIHIYKLFFHILSF